MEFDIVDIRCNVIDIVDIQKEHNRYRMDIVDDET